MNVIANPWAVRFEGLESADAIRSRTKVIVPPLSNLTDITVEVAVKRLESALESVFYPTSQCVAILQRLVGMAYAHCLAIYPDSRAYMSGVYSQSPPLRNFSFPICLTGLAGLGKTELIKAFIRMQAPDREIVVDRGHSPFPLLGPWLATVQARSDPTAVLAYLAGKSAKPGELIDECRRRAFKNGIPLLLADEFQFATGSSSANARVTQMLLSLAYVGIPFVFAANFSLLLRLQKRPEEDRQRLLSDPIVLLPDHWASDDWVMTLVTQRSVAPDFFVFDPKKDAQILHGFAAGRKRAMAKLLTIAFRAEFSRGGSVDLEALRRAYHSPQFFEYREESEILASQAIRNAPNKKRKDLWCPIPLPPDSSLKFLESTTRAREQQVAEAELRAALTSDERSTVKEMEKAAKKTAQKSATVLPLDGSRKVTGEDLKRNANWLRDNL